MKVKSKYIMGNRPVGSFDSYADYEEQFKFARDVKGNILKCVICRKKILLEEYIKVPTINGIFEHWCRNCFEKFLKCKEKGSSSDPMDLSHEIAEQKHLNGG